MLNEMKWRIWFEQYDDSGNSVGGGVYFKEYIHYGTAQRIARQRYGDKKHFKYQVAKRNPWVKYPCRATCDICGKEYATEESRDGGFPITSFIDISDRSSDYRNRYSVYKPCPACMATIKGCIENLKASES